MKYTTALFFLIVGLFLSGCEAPNIQGNVFVIKGDGDIKPAAGRTVYLIPEKSVHALLSRAINDVTPSVTASYVAAIKPFCHTAKKTIVGLHTTIVEELRNIKDSGDIPPTGCALLKEEVKRIEDTFKSVESGHLDKVAGIESKLKNLEAKRANKIKSHANTLKKKATEPIC